MTVQELFDRLKADLNNEPEIADREIVCKSDSEGNDFHHLAGIDTSKYWYEGEYSLEVLEDEELEECGYDEDDKKRMTPCAVIYPC